MYRVTSGVVGLCALNREQGYFVEMTAAQARKSRNFLKKADPYMLAFFLAEPMRGKGENAISFEEIQTIHAFQALQGVALELSYDTAKDLHVAADTGSRRVPRT